MLILGGSATVTDLTGMSTIAVSDPSKLLHAMLLNACMILQACFLIPIGVSIYVVVGGMRSTLLCD